VNRVLVATDFSDASLNALRYSAAIARYYAARLYIVHVVSSLGYKLAGPGADVLAAEDATRDLRELWNRVAGNGERIEVELIVRRGDVTAVLSDLIREERIDAIVIGTHGRTGFMKVAMGSVAEGIFRNSTCPVLIVGPNSSSDWPERQLGAEKAILIALDSRDASLKGLPYAASCASRSHSKLVLLHVAEPVPATVPSIAGNRFTPGEEDLGRAVRQRLADFQGTDLSFESEVRVTYGLPVDDILSEAARTAAGLIVLGFSTSLFLYRLSTCAPPLSIRSSSTQIVPC